MWRQRDIAHRSPESFNRNTPALVRSRSLTFISLDRGRRITLLLWASHSVVYLMLFSPSRDCLGFWNVFSMFFAPYVDHRRSLRRVCTWVTGIHGVKETVRMWKANCLASLPHHEIIRLFFSIDQSEGKKLLKRKRVSGSMLFAKYLLPHWHVMLASFMLI